MTAALTCKSAAARGAAAARASAPSVERACVEVVTARTGPAGSDFSALLANSEAAEDLARERDHLEDARVLDAIEDLVGFLARLQQAVVAQDREVLGDVALRGADRVDDLQHRELLVADQAKDLEPQGMGHRLHRLARLADVLALADEVEDVVGGAGGGLAGHGRILGGNISRRPY